MPPRNPPSAATPPPTFRLEFQAEDDAWYAVRLVVRGETLTVKYKDFSADFDEVFRAGEFTTLAAVESFGRRFRNVSVQLQDGQCSKIVECMTVCASHAFQEDDVRFYDAVVEEVQYKNHSFNNGEEECTCDFILFWQDGPNAGTLTSARVENICLLQHNPVTDPKLASFMKKSRDKIEMAPFNSVSEGRINNHPDPVTGIKIKEEDERHQYQITIENMEKDLGPLTIFQFIHDQIQLTPEVYIVPNYSSHIRLTGIVIANSRDELNKLIKFFNSPEDHMIISPRGRPLVVAEAPRIVKESPYMMNWIPFPHGANDLRIVHSGCEDYKKAKRLWDLYMEFKKQVSSEFRVYESLVQKFGAS